MNHGSLFTGIGGFDLAAQWIGWINKFQVEKDKHCLYRLNKLFPYIPKYDDVRTFKGTLFKHTIDVLSGGDPCQPHSVAGLGKGTKDDRFLWPEMFRIAQELNVPWIVNENVSGSIANGVLDLKIDDLESIGYTCQTYCIPAEAVGALHQRERVWLIAYNADFDRGNKIARDLQRAEEKESSLEVEQYKIHQPRKPVDLWIDNTDSNFERLEKQYHASVAKRFKEGVSGYFGFGSYPHGHITRNSIESGVMGMLDGLPEGMDYAERNQRIKALGNAIVPQVAFEIFKAISKINIE
jgi:DNA (cytosine-5)-methyltransferase 1